MIKQRVAVRGVLLSGLIGAAFAGFTAEGCSSGDNGSSSGDDGGFSGSTSSSSSSSGGKSSSSGVGSSSGGGSSSSSGASSSGTASSSSGSGSSSGSSSGGSSSSSGASSRGGSSSSGGSSGGADGGGSSSGGSDAGDGGGSSGGDATTSDATTSGDSGDGATSDDGGDASDASNQGDASDASSCVTSAILSGDGGSVAVGDGGANLLYSFDNITQVPSGWVVAVTDPADSGLTPTLSVNTTEGHTCPGSLQLTIPFTAFGQQADMKIPQPYPGGTLYSGVAFHAWVKVEIPGDAGITVSNEFLQGNGQVYAQWGQPPDGGPYTAQNFVNFYPPAATSWQEVVVPIGDDGGSASIDLDQLGANLQLNAQDSGAPTTAILLLDDIWFE